MDAVYEMTQEINGKKRVVLRIEEMGWAPQSIVSSEPGWRYVPTYLRNLLGWDWEWCNDINGKLLRHERGGRWIIAEVIYPLRKGENDV